MSTAPQTLVGSPISEPVAPFPRLCQATIMLGKVFSHNYGDDFPSETAQYEAATQLYSEASALAGKITEEAEADQDFFGHASALALTFSALCTLCDKYSRPKGGKFQRGLAYASAFKTKLIDIAHQDDGRFNRNAEQRKQS